MAATSVEDPPDFGGEEEEGVEDVAPGESGSGADGVDGVASGGKDVPMPLAPLQPGLTSPAPAGLLVSSGPTVVLPPVVPPPEEEVLPLDHEGDPWLELLRDGFVRQMREENECEEPPPFHRAMAFASEPGMPTQKGKFPRQALNAQLQLLLRLRSGDNPLLLGKGLGKGPLVRGMQSLSPNPSVFGTGGFPAASALPHLLKHMQSGGVRMPQTQQQIQQAQLIIAAAKALQANGAVKGLGKFHGKDVGKITGKLGVQRTIGK
eukprot:TRINITY_DN68983_c0_g1_i1.p1 TRINITY_DN68983_c0_g1~~TRINITY_DN68983_c0_g1_i1.p1  ORF type:complete len:293 (-),score=68.44 TRINITY_DN68983_c0_g1_i1:125-913(-)